MLRSYLYYKFFRSYHNTSLNEILNIKKLNWNITSLAVRLIKYN